MSRDKVADEARAAIRARFALLRESLAPGVESKRQFAIMLGIDPENYRSWEERGSMPSKDGAEIMTALSALDVPAADVVTRWLLDGGTQPTLGPLSPRPATPIRILHSNVIRLEDVFARFSKNVSYFSDLGDFLAKRMANGETLNDDEKAVMLNAFELRRHLSDIMAARLKEMERPQKAPCISRYEDLRAQDEAMAARAADLEAMHDAAEDFANVPARPGRTPSQCLRSV